MDFPWWGYGTLHGSNHERGLLELQQFLIKEQRAPRIRTNTYAILDPSTQEQVGVARAEVGSLTRLLRRLVRKTLPPNKLEVYETEDESLVFTVRRALGLWRQRIEIYDADDHFMGYGENENSVLCGCSGFHLCDRRGLPFAKVERACRSREFRFVSRDGHELGVIAWEGAGFNTESGPATGSCLVSVRAELADQPLAKMLLLGAALAVALDYHGDGR